MKNCPFCGLSNQDYAKFCIHCGQALPAQAAQETGASRPAEQAAPADLPFSAPQRSGDSYAQGQQRREPPPVTSRPSPYASLPHIPASAKRKDPAGKNSALGGIALTVGLIAVVVLLFWMGGTPSRTPARPASSLIPPGKYSMPPSPSRYVSSPRPTPSWSFEIVDVTLEAAPSGSQIYVNGELELTSDTPFYSGRVTVELYDENKYMLEDCSSSVIIMGSEIKFSILCNLNPSQIRLVDYYNVILQLHL